MPVLRLSGGSGRRQPTRRFRARERWQRADASSLASQNLFRLSYAHSPTTAGGRAHSMSFRSSMLAASSLNADRRPMNPSYALETWTTLRYERHDALTHRYYELHLTQDLWGEWQVQRIWGGVDTARGRASVYPLDNTVSAEDALTALQRRRVQRGYQLISQRA